MYLLILYSDARGKNLGCLINKTAGPRYSFMGLTTKDIHVSALSPDGGKIYLDFDECTLLSPFLCSGFDRMFCSVWHSHQKCQRECLIFLANRTKHTFFYVWDIGAALPLLTQLARTHPPTDKIFRAIRQIWKVDRAGFAFKNKIICLIIALVMYLPLERLWIVPEQQD